MWHLYVYSLLAGLVGANGVPHFVRGITGHRHMTPFKKDAGAVVNVFWGWLNFVVAMLLLYYSPFHEHILRAFALVALGALVSAVALATTSSKIRNQK